MIEIANLNKKLNGKDILKDINIKVERGSIFGIIGANGAGKTTLIKCLTGILKPDTGGVKILGEDVYENINVKSRIGYVADQNGYSIAMKVREIAEFYQRLYPKFSMARFDKLNLLFKLDNKKRIRQLSKGMKMRLSIMLNLASIPDVLIMDEPTSGLDPIIKREVFRLLVDDVAERGMTLFISSHNLSDLERICDSVAIIEDGAIKYCNSVEEMKKKIRKLQCVFKDDAAIDFVSLSKEKGILHVDKVGKVYSVITENYSDELKNKLESNAMFVEEIDLSLEDMFIYSVGSEIDYEVLK